MLPWKVAEPEMESARQDMLAGVGRVFKRAGRLFDFIPLTTAGLILTLVIAAAVYYRGVGELDMVTLAAGGALLAVQLLAMVAVIVATLVMRSRISSREQPTFLELVSGRRTHSGFSVGFWYYVPLVRLSWTVREFSAETTAEPHRGRLRELLKCKRRGLTTGVTRRFTVTDTLGLSSLSWQQYSPGRARALPYPGRLEQPDILLSLVSGEDISDPRGDPQGDRVDMRQYQKGDPMKFILWKVYSRSGKVMVRVPERALAARPRACCYLLSGNDDEASAALARVLIQMDMLGEEWRFGANGRDRDAVRKDDAFGLLALSGNQTETDCHDLRRFLIQAEKDGYGFCLVLAPPGPKSLADKVYDLLNRSGMNSEVWIGLDLEDKSESRWLSALDILESRPLEPRRIHDAWGGRATLIERTTGRVMARTQGRGR